LQGPQITSQADNGRSKTSAGAEKRRVDFNPAQRSERSAGADKRESACLPQIQSFSYVDCFH
jgi:hypothetical protein